MPPLRAMYFTPILACIHFQAAFLDAVLVVLMGVFQSSAQNSVLSANKHSFEYFGGTDDPDIQCGRDFENAKKNPPQFQGHAAPPGPVRVNLFAVPVHTPNAVAYSLVVVDGMIWSGIVPLPRPPGGPPETSLGGQYGPASVPVHPPPKAASQHGAEARHPSIHSPVNDVSYTIGPQGELRRRTNRSGTVKLS